MDWDPPPTPRSFDLFLIYYYYNYDWLKSNNYESIPVRSDPVQSGPVRPSLDWLVLVIYYLKFYINLALRPPYVRSVLFVSN
jgi:hypothetical protein